MSVPVRSILERKGSEVVTVKPDDRVDEAVKVLRRANVGAVVVSDSGEDVAGIVSERDIVRRLADGGTAILERSVTDIMSSPVTTCGPDQTADELMSMMTEGRIRHLPVVEDGRMVGLVSIGDVVKSYVDELEVRNEALTDYVSGTRY
ncbi:MAG: CBS domain-containing protein [Actinobacteria bacterium]|nr:CBS domain-containing protein [Actinomycetota bacterium]